MILVGVLLNGTVQNTLGSVQQMMEEFDNSEDAALLQLQQSLHLRQCFCIGGGRESEIQLAAVDDAFQQIVGIAVSTAARCDIHVTRLHQLCEE